MPDCKTLHAGGRWFVSLLLSVILFPQVGRADAPVRDTTSALIASGPTASGQAASGSTMASSTMPGSTMPGSMKSGSTKSDPNIGPATSTLRPQYASSRIGTPSDTTTGTPRPEYAPSSMSIQWRSDSPAPASDSTTSDSTSDDSDANADDVWQRIRAGFKLPNEQNALVANQEAWYAARPDYVRRMILRSRRYLYHIVTEVERRSMPMEIALLPMVESAFNPKAYSTSDASGIWQFIPSTGRNYGLRQDRWYDGRNDITAATNAALDYLGKLYLDFGDWELALAAYNCGEGCVTRAIEKNLKLGLPTDYASLPLSAETRNYVPKLMAVKHLILDPQHFGVSLDALPNQPYFAQVAVRSGMDVTSAARLADMSVQDFKALNPAFQRNLIRSDTPVNVLVPVDKSDRFEKNLKTEVWDTWKPEVVRKGEHVVSVARRFDTTEARLAEHNSLALRRGRFVRTQTILVPVKSHNTLAAQSDTLAANSNPTPTDDGDTSVGATTQYTVGAGDTLYAIARRYHTTVAALQSANPDMRLPVKAGQVLALPRNDQPADDRAASSALQKVAYTVKLRHAKARPVARHYTVRRGDTLASIAERFDVRLAELKSLNPSLRHSSRIQPGKRLLVAGR